mmetsp:Transcript_11339/g.26129  ORF Transcript_11339/g.26129 Transcript_11339/m.26129 type:complete len:1105 (-) Transcript_11339:163-3477(-)
MDYKAVPTKDNALALPDDAENPSTQPSKGVKSLEKEKVKKDKKSKKGSNEELEVNGNGHKNGHGNGHSNGKKSQRQSDFNGTSNALALTEEFGIPMPPLTRPQDVELAQKLDDVKAKLTRVEDTLTTKRKRPMLRRFGMTVLVCLGIVLLLGCIFGATVAAIEAMDVNGDDDSSSSTAIVIDIPAVVPGATPTPGAQPVVSHSDDAGANDEADEIHHPDITFNLCGDLTSDTKFYKIYRYIIECEVHVVNGATLTIEAGTTIEAQIEANATGSLPTLYIHSGSKIVANGTLNEPITFTSVLEHIEEGVHGLWRGLVIAGQAPVEAADDHLLEVGVLHGGDHEDDNSGVLRYVRIWYAGLDHTASISFYGAGSGTTVEFIESAYSAGDGVKMHGGRVNARYVAVYFAYEDALHYKSGYQGDIQYAFVIVASLGTGLEVEGHEDQQPRTHPNIRSATFLGNWPHNLGSMLQFRNGAGATLQNIIVQNVEIAVQHDNCAAELHTQGRHSQPVDYPDYFYFSTNNIVYSPSATTRVFLASPSCQGGLTTVHESSPLLQGIPEKLEPLPSGALSPVPSFESVAMDPAEEEVQGHGFFETVLYSGAFDANEDMWLRSWTWLDEHAKLLPPRVEGAEYLCGALKQDKWILANITYVLTCQYFVRNNATLYMEPGSTIRSERDFAGRSPAVIIEQGSKIVADCTKELPCTFTTNVADESILPLAGLWGGLIILGHAPLQDDEGKSIDGLEGGNYGGSFPEDDSGILRYVRIWYAGHQLGGGVHIAALTMAAVGSKTIVDHIDIAYSEYDGVELLGGTVDVRHIAVTLPHNVGIDCEDGYRGNLQYLFLLQGKHSSGCLKFKDDLHSYDVIDSENYRRTYPIVRGATCIGDPETSDALLYVADGAGGDVRESIFAGFVGLGQYNCEDEEVTQEEPYQAAPQHFFFGTTNVYKNRTSGAPPMAVDQDGACLNRSTVTLAAWADVAADQLDVVSSTAPLFLFETPEVHEPLNNSFIDPRPSREADGIMRTLILSRTDYEAREILPPEAVTGFLEQPGYIGAFSWGEDNEGNWMSGWTWLDLNGKLAYAAAWRTARVWWSVALASLLFGGLASYDT